MNNDKMMKCLHVHEKDRMYAKTHETQQVLNMEFYPICAFNYMLVYCLLLNEGGILY